MKYPLTLLLSLITLTTMAQSNNAYSAEIDKWVERRYKDLKAEDGWLNLAGLFWLQPGENSFGNNAAALIAFTHPNMPVNAGTFILKGKEVVWKSAKGVLVTKNQNTPVDNEVIFHGDSTKNPTLRMGQFLFTVIKRGDKIGIRFRDTNSAALLTFKKIQRFPTDISWNIPATLEPSLVKTIEITNVLGQTGPQPSPGKLVFTVKGVTYKLAAIDEGGDELFVIFGDATSGNETYPAGRFVYVKKPDVNGKTFIDFNKAFNPPCAFTDFATCPLPPAQNRLSLPITAGEKTFHPLTTIY